MDLGGHNRGRTDGSATNRRSIWGGMMPTRGRALAGSAAAERAPQADAPRSRYAAT
ncbi:hypothetical protein AKJ08_2322 [Vulgatibacter incomptus]|uniref:Uncharacterized protein n=1 Tax=Vulgatibacter incomptus TaxID=1391653 RepID=A0A0K1PEJ5_9BACT|nr:hypothetical protein AKJ08_2322 [Vulgatibacter incomptus]